MYEPLLEAFDVFPDEALLIGRILAGYGTLELDLMNCVAASCQQFDRAFKEMYRQRGETNRIRKAERIGNFHYNRLGLLSDFALAIGAMEHCLIIRNEYSHCQWHHDRTSELCFVDLEELARRKAPVNSLRDAPIRYVDIGFLKNQLDYFSFTSQMFVWLNWEGSFRDNRRTIQNLPKPAVMQQPPLHRP
jgi:hypothetical protein